MTTEQTPVRPSRFIHAMKLLHALAEKVVGGKLGFREDVFQWTSMSALLLVGAPRMLDSSQALGVAIGVLALVVSGFLLRMALGLPRRLANKPESAPGLGLLRRPKAEIRFSVWVLWLGMVAAFGLLTAVRGGSRARRGVQRDDSADAASRHTSQCRPRCARVRKAEYSERASGL